MTRWRAGPDGLSVVVPVVLVGFCLECGHQPADHEGGTGQCKVTLMAVKPNGQRKAVGRCTCGSWKA